MEETEGGGGVGGATVDTTTVLPDGCRSRSVRIPTPGQIIVNTFHVIPAHVYFLELNKVKQLCELL